MAEDPLPRVTIRFCNECGWMLRAAYYAQELLSTFATALAQVSLQPSTGGTFTVTIQTAPAQARGETHAQTPTTLLLWDRKRDGGFPETKELKRRVRDVVAPGRDLGHVDGHKGGGRRGPEEKQQAETRRGPERKQEQAETRRGPEREEEQAETRRGPERKQEQEGGCGRRRVVDPAGPCEDCQN